MSNFAGKGSEKFANVQIFQLKVESLKSRVWGVGCIVYGVEAQSASLEDGAKRLQFRG